MKKLKKLLVLTFVIGMSFLLSDNILATNYKVNIAVLGNQQKGKTQIIRRIFGLPFQSASARTKWEHGAYGMEKQYTLDGDTFECNYYDAPGYLQNEDATIDQQINSTAVKNANIALIVVDPQQKSGIDSAYTSSIHEALQRHTLNVRTVNPKCKIIVVANRVDEIKNPQELAKYRHMLDGARLLYSQCESDGVFTSAKDGTGIQELEEKIINLMRLDKSNFPTFDSSFIICKNDGSQQRKDRCIQGYKNDLYCSEGCLMQAESKTCAYVGCSSKERFLRVKGQGFVSPHTDDLYCSKSCYTLSEGTYCSHEKCTKKFVVADNSGFVTSSKTGKKYCCSEHMKASEDGCVLL